MSPFRAGTHAAPLEPDDLRITDDRYGTTLPLERCGDCGFVFARSDQLERLTGLYAELDDTEYTETSTARRQQMDELVDLARSSRPRARTLLDVGAAAGLLVEAAGDLGFDATGLEPSSPLARRARERGLRVVEGVLPHPELTGRRFDVVTLIDVIEHVGDPVGLLRDATRLLADDGVLIVVTPDRGGVTARLLGRRWWHYRLAHVGYFTRSSLALALERVGLRVEQWGRPHWYLPAEYLADRLARYHLPTGATSRLRRSQRLAPLWKRTVRLNLLDSLTVVAAR